MSKRRKEPEEPEGESGSELGRAIARERKKRKLFASGVARTFPLPAADRTEDLLLGGPMILACALQLLFRYNFVVVYLALVLLFYYSVVFPYLSSILFTPSKVGLLVGVDGVLVRGRFIPHAQIREVGHELRSRRPAGGYGTESWNAADGWSVRLFLVDGEELDLGTRWARVDAKDEEGADLVHAIKAVHGAAQSGPGVEEDAVARGDRTGAEWLHALRQIGSNTTGVYRAHAVDTEQLTRLLDDAGTKLSIRAAAALVLAASGDAAPSGKLRIAAQSVVNSRLRIALESVADARDDAAVAEALDTLDTLAPLERKARA